MPLDWNFFFLELDAPGIEESPWNSTRVRISENKRTFYVASAHMAHSEVDSFLFVHFSEGYQGLASTEKEETGIIHVSLDKCANVMKRVCFLFAIFFFVFFSFLTKFQSPTSTCTTLRFVVFYFWLLKSEEALINRLIEIEFISEKKTLHYRIDIIFGGKSLLIYIF